MRIVNAGEASFPGGWEGYRAVASYDRKRWFRVDSTSYDKSNGILTIEYAPTKDAVYFAYFAPYPYERHQALIAEVQSSGTDEKEVALEMVRAFFFFLSLFPARSLSLFTLSLSFYVLLYLLRKRGTLEGATREREKRE